MNAKSKWISGRLVRLVRFFRRFSVVVCVGSFLIQLSLIRFNVVVVIGHDDIENYKLYNACDMAFGLEFEEAFLANVERTGKEVTVILFLIIGL